MNSIQDSLNSDEKKKWLKNILIFSAPALISFLVAISGGIDLKVAFGMVFQALIASAIDLLQKYKQGVPQSFDIPNLSVSPNEPESTPEVLTPQK